MKRIISLLVLVVGLIMASSCLAFDAMKNDPVLRSNNGYAYAYMNPNTYREYAPQRDSDIIHAAYLDVVYITYTTSKATYDKLMSWFGYYDYYGSTDYNGHYFSVVHAKPRQINGKTIYCMGYIITSTAEGTPDRLSLRRAIQEVMLKEDHIDLVLNTKSIQIDKDAYPKWERTYLFS